MLFGKSEQQSRRLSGCINDFNEFKKSGRNYRGFECKKKRLYEGFMCKMPINVNEMGNKKHLNMFETCS